MNTVTEVQVGLPDCLRLRLYFLLNGSVVIVPDSGFAGTHEYVSGGVSSTFDPAGFSLWNDEDKTPNEYGYNMPYPLAKLPMLKAWLIQQKLDNPFN